MKEFEEYLSNSGLGLELPVHGSDSNYLKNQLEKEKDMNWETFFYTLGLASVYLKIINRKLFFQKMEIPEVYDCLPDECFKASRKEFYLIRKRDSIPDVLKDQNFDDSSFEILSKKNIIEEIKKGPEKYGLNPQKIKMETMYGEKSKTIEKKCEEVYDLYDEFLQDKRINKIMNDYYEEMENVFNEKKFDANKTSRYIENFYKTKAC